MSNTKFYYRKFSNYINIEDFLEKGIYRNCYMNLKPSFLPSFIFNNVYSHEEQNLMNFDELLYCKCKLATYIYEVLFGVELNEQGFVHKINKNLTDNQKDCISHFLWIDADNTALRRSHPKCIIL